MKKTLLITGALVAFAAPVFAQSIPGTCNLAWNDCWLGSGSPVPESQDKSSVCTSTAGFQTFYASFDPPTTLPKYIGMNAVVDLQTSSGGGVLSPWWRYDLGTNTCHGGKISHSADFTADPNATGCVDIFGGAASGGGNYVTPGAVPMPSARIKEIWGVPEPVPPTPFLVVSPGNEYYAFKVTLLNSLNSGFTIATCPGCLDKACILLNQMNLAQPAPDPDVVLTTGPQQFVRWQGGTGTQLCPAATPNRTSTWGQVKALYR
jgi:hypothetical protein